MYLTNINFSAKMLGSILALVLFFTPLNMLYGSEAKRKYKETQDSKKKNSQSREQDFLDACKTNIIHRVRALLPLIEDINTANDKEVPGFSGLHFAAQNDNSDLMELLIAEGADVNYSDDKDAVWKHTPLHVAARESNISACKVLLNHGADANAQVLRLRWTPLCYAVSKGDFKVVELLLQRGARFAQLSILNTGSKSIRLPHTHYAEVLRIGLNYNWSVLHLAADKGDINICRILLNAGADPNERISTYDWSEKKDSSCHSPTPLLCAVLSKHLEVCRLLLEAGADSSEEFTAGGMSLPLLAIAATCSTGEIVCLLRLDGAYDSNFTTNLCSFTLLHFAAGAGNNDVCRVLLDESLSDIEVVDGEGYTPLLLAAKAGHIETSRLLLDAGAEIFARVQPGLLTRSLRFLERLLASHERGYPDIGWNVFQVARENGRQELLRFLLDHVSQT